MDYRLKADSRKLKTLNLMRNIFTIALLLMIFSWCPTVYSKGIRIAFIGDPQVDSWEELDYARKSVYKELRLRKDLDLVLVLGDIVNENPQLMLPSKESLDSLKCPYFCVPGNHDDLLSYKKVFGYADTSFVFARRGVSLNVILMDNATGHKNGSFDESQMTWLASVLKSAPKVDRTLLLTHVPISHSKDKASFGKILSECTDLEKVLLISGHTHTVSRSNINLGGVEVEEIIGGAACGTWWRGEKEKAFEGVCGMRADSAMIPHALMSCGSRRGYFVGDFNSRGDYKLDYKLIGRKRRLRTSVFVEGDSLYVNVYGGHVDAMVEASWGRASYLCRRSERPALECRAIISLNSGLTRSERREMGSDYIPMLRRKSTHVWVCPSSAANIPGSPEKAPKARLKGKVRIRYYDDHMRFSQRIRPCVSPLK